MKNLINYLELGYSPMTAYEFAITKNDINIEKALEKSSLYLITQRAVITFENFNIDLKKYEVNFEIHQKGNKNILKCRLPLIQKKVGSNEKDNIAVAFNFLNNKDKLIEKLPVNNLHGFSLCKILPNEKTEFLIWFSPEKLIQNWKKDLINCTIEGDIKMFLNYKVLYVGKATKQGILKRLTGHNTFQDILSLETPVTDKQLPANEITILCLQFRDNIQLESFNSKSKIESIVNSVNGVGFPKQEKVFLDAEKALINLMKPNYNKELFKNYPKSKDGLYQNNYNTISYRIVDPITLIYEEGNINGGFNEFDGDIILIEKKSKLKIIKTTHNTG